MTYATGNVPGSQKRKARKEKDRKRKRRVEAAERKVEGWMEWTKNKLFQPAFAGGIFAVGMCLDPESFVGHLC
jgi:hypothetical protein